MAGGAAAIVVALAVVWFLVAVVVSGHTATSERQRILMDSDWRFHRGEVASAAVETQGLPVTHWRWTADDAGATDAGKMADPALDASGADWKDATTGQDTFNGRTGFAWFRTTLPENSTFARTLHFDGVDDNATVYLNGRKLTSHEGWDDPFDVDLKPAWKEGGPNVVAVLVENTGGAGGITRPVFLGRQPANQAPVPALPDFVTGPESPAGFSRTSAPRRVGAPPVPPTPGGMGMAAPASIGLINSLVKESVAPPG